MTKRVSVKITVAGEQDVSIKLSSANDKADNGSAHWHTGNGVLVCMTMNRMALYVAEVYAECVGSGALTRRTVIVAVIGSASTPYGRKGDDEVRASSLGLHDQQSCSGGAVRLLTRSDAV